MQLVGIGDLHLDSPLAQYIPNHNKVVLDEVRLVVDWAVERSIKTVILYGDIGHKPQLSYDAHCRLISLFSDYPHIRFIIVKGNHDTKSDSENSLLILKQLERSKGVPNIRVIDERPTVLFEKTDTPVYVLPWPFSKTKQDMLNVLHTEVDGAKWDTGRPVACTNKINPKHLSVLGHIHTAQRIGNAHFSGTLYQTNFGEKPNKYFHHIIWTGDVKTSKVKLIPHVPKYTLLNAVIESKKQVKDLPKDKHTLIKVFVNKDVVLPDDVFDAMPNVVKFNNFSSKEELQVLMRQELSLDDLSSEVRLDLDSMLNDWMLANNTDKELMNRVPDVLTNLLSKAKR